MNDRKPVITRDHDDIRITLPADWIETVLRKRGIEIVDADVFAFDLIDALWSSNALTELVQSEAEFAIEDGDMRSAVKERRPSRTENVHPFVRPGSGDTPRLLPPSFRR